MVNKKMFWKVPLFCMAAGVIAFNAVVFLVGRFTLITLPDGSITADNTRVLIIYGGVLLLHF